MSKAAWGSLIALSVAIAVIGVVVGFPRGIYVGATGALAAVALFAIHIRNEQRSFKALKTALFADGLLLAIILVLFAERALNPELHVGNTIAVYLALFLVVVLLPVTGVIGVVSAVVRQRRRRVLP